MFFNSCTAYEISEIVKELENGKASDIPIIVIKKCSTIITEHICGFMNNFIEIGIFPDILKRGCITPIFKGGGGGGGGSPLKFWKTRFRDNG